MRICNGVDPERRSIACPRPLGLEAAARRLDLPGHEQEDIEHHLETCESCQARLDEIASGGLNLQGQMRNLRPDAAADAPGLKRVIGVLKDELDPDSDATHSNVSAPSDDLSFLDPSETPGELGKLGPYRVQEVLGQGGMGIVMKAFDPTLHRAVAIKILAPQLAASSSARQRFAREAKAAAAIRNEHVVAIHAVNEWKGLPFLVMEYIPGSSLQARIDRTAPLDLNSILRIGMQAATGLAAAHAQGLVHRDIKPSNILLENCVERVKITDFGLARAVDDASLTQSGVVAGTPLFMAPEQARCETIDHRADLFSLGAVLYAMCTGRSPFRASTTLGVLKRVCDDTHRPVQEVNPDVPNWLSQIIDKLLAKDREDRYQTAEEVVDLLGGHLARRQRGIRREPGIENATFAEKIRRSGRCWSREGQTSAPQMAGDRRSCGCRPCRLVCGCNGAQDLEIPGADFRASGFQQTQGSGHRPHAPPGPSCVVEWPAPGAWRCDAQQSDRCRRLPGRGVPERRENQHQMV